MLRFCRGKKAVLVVEEGQPDYHEQHLNTILRRNGVDTVIHGKDLLPVGGDYTVVALRAAVRAFVERHHPAAFAKPVALGMPTAPAKAPAVAAATASVPAVPAMPSGTQDIVLPPRPLGLCVGCPERPIFSSLTLAMQDHGPHHISSDIGCHLFSILPPFQIGATTMGYGLGWAGASAFNTPKTDKRALAIMGDGGFWHNGLLTGVQSALFNGDDAVLLIFKNGYTSATGTQDILNTPEEAAKDAASDKRQSLVHTNQTIESTLKGLGVQWLRTVHTYHVQDMKATLTEAFSTGFQGLKVIVAEGECQLERQRRIKPWLASLMAQGERVERVKYGVDEDVCNGDHACIRLSGCPTLTLKDNPDPLKVDPVATVIDGCVGCGLCGANAHAATLCPSFYRAEVVQNPKWHERLWHGLQASIVRLLQPGQAA